MKYRVTIGEASHTVRIPDQLPDGIPVVIEHGGQVQTVIWHRALGVMTLVGTSGVEENLRLRGYQVARYEGESESRVTVESWYKGVQSIAGVVAYDLPGMGSQARQAASGQIIRSQMTGKALKVLVAPGDTVKPGDPLVIIEAMKMENKIFSNVAGKVASVGVKAGDAVQTGKELLRITL